MTHYSLGVVLAAMVGAFWLGLMIGGFTALRVVKRELEHRGISVEVDDE